MTLSSTPNHTSSIQMGFNNENSEIREQTTVACVQNVRWFTDTNSISTVILLEPQRTLTERDKYRNLGYEKRDNEML